MEISRILGYVMQTSPSADHIIGFSGPTNVLLIFNTNHVFQGISILWSRDTQEHLQQVLADSDFMEQLGEINRDDLTKLYEIDGVSGATLTSLAIAQSIVHRLGGETHRFPQVSRPINA